MFMDYIINKKRIQGTEKSNILKAQASFFFALLLSVKRSKDIFIIWSTAVSMAGIHPDLFILIWCWYSYLLSWPPASGNGGASQQRRLSRSRPPGSSSSHPAGGWGGGTGRWLECFQWYQPLGKNKQLHIHRAASRGKHIHSKAAMDIQLHILNLDLPWWHVWWCNDEFSDC